MSPSLRLSLMAVLVSLAACSEGITAPKCDRCDEMRVLTDRSEYRPGSVVAFTITNRTSSVLRYDWCSVSLASRGSTDGFEVRYTPARRCGFGADIQDVIDHMVLIDPGASLRDSLTINSGANQSQYRLHIWLVDETGAPEAGNPVASNIFDVFPAASASIAPH